MATSALADHLNSTLYKTWKENRKPLESRWQANWEAFRGILTGDWKACEGEGYRSNTNINLTRQKAMAAFAIILQQVVRGGQIVFSVNPDDGNPWIKEMLGEEWRSILEEDAQKMKEEVRADLARCDAEKSYARNILAAAVYGETYAKEVTASFPKTRYRPMLPEGIQDIRGIDPNQVMWESFADDTPGFSWVYVPIWEIVRDMETDDLQECTGIFHERHVSPYFLRELMDEPDFDAKAIKRVLSKVSEKTGEKESENTLLPGLKHMQNRSNSICYREYHGRIPRVLAEYHEASLSKEEESPAPKPEELSDGDEVEVITVVADDEIVMFARNDMDRPFERAVWEDALDDLGGQGVADNVRDVHKAMTGSFRAYEDGAKASSALILVLREALISNPEDISKGIQAGFAKIQLEEGPGSMNDAVQQLKIENPANNVVGLIEQLKGFIEEESLVPRISTGMSVQGDNATAYEMSQRVERAGTYIGMVIRNQDEMLCEPMIQRVIDRKQRDPDFSGPRGEFVIEAQGFHGFEARNTRVAAIYRLLELSMQDEDIRRRRKLDPLLEEIAASLDFTAKDFWHSDAEMKEKDLEVEALAMAEAMKADPTEKAKIEKDLAAAEKDRAEIVLDQRKLELEAAKVEMEKAETVANIERGLKEPNEQA